MKKIILYLLITIFNINCYSQISFEKGYYIDNSNQKVDCLIKNIDWKNNPTEFEYKLTGSSDKQTASIKLIKEFGIYNISKYCRHNVKIDRSSSTLLKMSKVKNAVFIEEEIFLKVLIQGKASLYSYGNLQRYFYSKDDSNIDQLVYKEYLNVNDKIQENNRYRQQLWSDLKCSTYKMSLVENLKYRKNELTRFL